MCTVIDNQNMFRCFVTKMWWIISCWHLTNIFCSLQVYEIHINGVRHCSLRYRQLHTLHEKLKREFHPLPSFPPKKLMALSLAQLEERRLNLEKYLQLLSQDPRYVCIRLFENVRFSFASAIIVWDGLWNFKLWSKIS